MLEHVHDQQLVPEAVHGRDQRGQDDQQPGREQGQAPHPRAVALARPARAAPAERVDHRQRGHADQDGRLERPGDLRGHGN